MSNQLAQRSIKKSNQGHLIYPLQNSSCPTCQVKIDGIVYAANDGDGNYTKLEITGNQGLTLSPCFHQLPRGWGIVHYSDSNTGYITRLASSFSSEIPEEPEGGEIIVGTVVDTIPKHLELENPNYG